MPGIAQRHGGKSRLLALVDADADRLASEGVSTITSAFWFGITEPIFFHLT
jgi:hypothetical protein